MSNNTKELDSEKLVRLGVYIEYGVGDKWCFKYQFPMLDCVIVSDPDKEKAASKFFIEFLKSLHYSLMELRKNERFEELKALIEKMEALKDENINHTIRILKRQINYKG